MSLLRNLKCQKLVPRLCRVRYALNYKRNFISSDVAATTTTAPAMPEAAATSIGVNAAASLPRFGQPTHESHPHMLKAGELVAGLELDEFKNRRLRLIASLQIFAQPNSQNQTIKQPCKNHFLIVPAATKKFISGTIPYKFRQSSNFYYLTGCLEPDSLLLVSADERSDIKTMLFVRQKNPRLEKWEGVRTSPEQAIGMFGVDEAYELSDFERVFAARIKGTKPVIWYDNNNSEQRNVTQRIKRLAEEEGAAIRTPSYYIQCMRLNKSLAEQAIMRESCRIAAASLNEVIAESHVGQTEHQLAAELEYKCRMRNASHLAFPPMVAAGENATTLNYSSNTQMTRAGQLLLMDVGCDYAGYSSDISRTWPIDGVFSKPQRLLYDVLLTIQKELLALIMHSGGETLNELQESMNLKLAKYLQELGIIKRDITEEDRLIQLAQQFCPHRVSHYLGLDVQDTESMSPNLHLSSGMVLTIEPGIYIGADRTDVPEEFRGIGMRVEDDVLINQECVPEVLTTACAKEVNDIDKLKQESRVASKN